MKGGWLPFLANKQWCCPQLVHLANEMVSTGKGRVVR